MLNRLDLQQIVDTATRCGFSFCEIYVESTRRLAHGFSQRLESVENSLDGGMAIRLWDGDRFRLCTSSVIATEAAIALIQKKRIIPCGSPESVDLATVLPDGEPLPSTLLARLRPYILQNTIEVTSYTKFYEVFNSTGLRGHGRERWAILSMEPTGEKLWASDLAGLEDSIRESPLPLGTLNTTPRWPMPSGAIPVYWSRRALSKMLLPLLRSFEGDSVLRRTSLLRRIEESGSIPFTIHDAPPRELVAFDHEGSVRKSTVFLENGSVKEIACDNLVARALKTESTGHCRRGSFRQPPTVSLWNPDIHGTNEQSDLLGGLDHGIHIENISVDSFDPVSAEIGIHFNDSRLIHHGRLGELVEGVYARLQMPKLLESFRYFSKDRRNVCLPIHKHGQDFATHIHCPNAISDGYELPGTVPKNHYW